MKRAEPSSDERTTILGIEQDVAKKLLLKYQQRRAAAGGRFGSRKLETEIFRAAGRPKDFELTREDIYNWLVGRTRRLGDGKFRMIEAFILSNDFAQVVPDARAIYAPLRNTVDIGYAFSQIYGDQPQDAGGLAELDGLWLITPREQTRDSVEEEILAWLTNVDWSYAYAFMRVRTIVGYDFSVAHFIRGETPPHYLLGSRASGFLFPKDGNLRVKVWNRASKEESRHELKLPSTAASRDSAVHANNNAARTIESLLIDFDPGDAPADKVLSTIAPYEPLMPQSIREGLRSKPPYFAYRCSLLIQRADRATEDDPLWIVDLKEQARVLRSVEKMFDSFLWSVVPDGTVEK